MQLIKHGTENRILLYGLMPNYQILLCGLISQPHCSLTFITFIALIAYRQSVPPITGHLSPFN